VQTKLSLPEAGLLALSVSRVYAVANCRKAIPSHQNGSSQNQCHHHFDVLTQMAQDRLLPHLSPLLSVYQLQLAVLRCLEYSLAAAGQSWLHDSNLLMQ
jgi:hypothetical protein